MTLDGKMKNKIGLKSVRCLDCKHKFNSINLDKVEYSCFSSDDMSDLRCPKCNSVNISGAENARDAKESCSNQIAGGIHTLV